MQNENQPNPASVVIGTDGMMQTPTIEETVSPNHRVQALGPVDQFLELLKNPEFEKLRKVLLSNAVTTEHGSLILMPTTVGDVLAREQLFGERRGLKRLEAELEDRLDDLNTLLEDRQQPTLDKQILKLQ